MMILGKMMMEMRCDRMDIDYFVSVAVYECGFCKVNLMHLDFEGQKGALGILKWIGCINCINVMDF